MNVNLNDARHALAYWEGWTMGEPLRDIGALDSILDAARSWSGLFEECENCEGDGTRADIYDDEGNFDVVKCLTCDGRGFSLNRERLERAARALRRRRFGEPTDLASGLVDSQPDPVIEADAESAILAFLFGDST